MSDQDPAIKKAVDELLPLSSHRLCMWHITTKLPEKVYIPLLFSTIEYSLQKNYYLIHNFCYSLYAYNFMLFVFFLVNLGNCQQFRL